MKEVLKIMSVNGYYQTKPVLEDITFTLHQEETIAIVGESGGGKSSLLRALMQGNTFPTLKVEGSILYQEENLLHMPRTKLNRFLQGTIAMIPQNATRSLSPVQTIQKQFIDVLLAHLDISKEQALKIAKEMLEKLQLDSELVLRSYPFALSGGMNQRVVIAMALALQPKILLCDEPTSNIDYQNQKQFIEILQSIQKEYQLSIIFVTHDLKIVEHIADQVLIIKEGRIVERNTPSEIFTQPQHPYTKELVGAIYES